MSLLFVNPSKILPVLCFCSSAQCVRPLYESVSLLLFLLVCLFFRVVIFPHMFEYCDKDRILRSVIAESRTFQRSEFFNGRPSRDRDHTLSFQ